MIKGIGIDIIDKSRFKKLKNRKDFTHQYLTDSEIDITHHSKNTIQHLATFFSIKEAVCKALQIGLHHGSYWHDISVDREFNVSLSGFPGAIVKDMNNLWVTKTCSNKYALSFVIVQK